jgi:3-deoxy-7-phosphoheptulonate synthase
LPTVSEIVRNELPLTEEQRHFIKLMRRQIRESLFSSGQSKFLVILGPCSVHCELAFFEYATKVSMLAKELPNLLLVMRCYFSKPRTVLGWKGLLHDPGMDGSYDIVSGIKTCRKLLLQAADLEIPAAFEILDLNLSEYLVDLVSYAAIGARTVESQSHREYVSSLDEISVGFKNSTSGSIQVAVDAVKSANSRHCFIKLDNNNRMAVFKTKGNPFAHVILRGGSSGPNYDLVNVNACLNIWSEDDRGENTGPSTACSSSTSSSDQDCIPIIIDCAHGNSGKSYEKQIEVFESLIEEISKTRNTSAGYGTVKGLMIESFIVAGNQPINHNFMEFGKSVTDPCIGWADTERLLRKLNKSLSQL